MSYRINRNIKKNKDKVANSKQNTNNSPISIATHAFPIYGMKTIEGNLQPYEIHGTSFYIGRNLFLTALHVTQYARQSEQTRIGYLGQAQPGCVKLHNYEIVEEFINSDLALIKCDEILTYENKPQAIKWSGIELLIFEEVRAMGYPHGYDAFKGFTNSRGFLGTLVGELDFERSELDARCYELSFQAPKGLSGSALLDKNYKIHGVVIGNNEKEMFVFQDKFIIHEAGKQIERHEIKNEVTFIGLAVSERHIFRLHSKYLGMSFHEYLRLEKLH